ncbi:hypothetical protein HII31_07527 [Pseudocercospora fuligena]|uniref:SprT-like domain-containing protein n=1 Tax=Pseudocercospora fuligena TaxID=685502 RepID=A0A8H6RIE7_9PEZI|nr:hypothetical protein HII31_07527 [Pseudocercospora fuligena]
MSNSQQDTMFIHEEPSEVLLHQSHYPIRLSEAAITSLDTTTPRTAQMARQLQAWFLQFQRQIDERCEYTSELTTALMKEGWKLLSKTFFLDSVSDVPVALDPDLLSKGKSWGMTGEVDGAVEVRLYPYIKINEGITSWMLLNTMAHEGAHAFILKYGCRNEICRDDECVKQKGVSTGVSGHGLAWNMLAEAIERVSGVSFGFRLDLGRRSSSVKEHEFLDTARAVEALFGGVDPRRDAPHFAH